MSTQSRKNQYFAISIDYHEYQEIYTYDVILVGTWKWSAKIAQNHMAAGRFTRN